MKLLSGILLVGIFFAGFYSAYAVDAAANVTFRVIAIDKDGLIHVQPMLPVQFSFRQVEGIPPTLHEVLDCKAETRDLGTLAKDARNQINTIELQCAKRTFDLRGTAFTTP